MKLDWSDKALVDLDRLYNFLARVNKVAAKKTIVLIKSKANILKQYPHLGSALERFDQDEVRRRSLEIMNYGMNYRARQCLFCAFGTAAKIDNRD